MLHIATSREIGQKCIEYAQDHFELVGMDECEIFVSVLYDKLIPKEYIDQRKCFNFHPGVLPEYRGAGAFSWAIINEEDETGVTLHEIDKTIDTGNIIEIRKFPIRDRDTAYTLFKKAEDVLYDMFVYWIDKLVDGKYFTTPQKEARAHLYTRRDLQLARDITRYKRAFTFPGKPSAFYMDNNNKINI